MEQQQRALVLLGELSSQTIVLESQLPHQIVKLLFKMSNLTINMTVLWDVVEQQQRALVLLVEFSSHTMSLSISFRNSTPLPNRQCSLSQIEILT